MCVCVCITNLQVEKLILISDLIVIYKYIRVYTAMCPFLSILSPSECDGGMARLKLVRNSRTKRV